MKDFWSLLIFKVRCRLKSEAGSNYLSYGWWIAEPILYMATFYMVFGVLMNRGTEDFVAYLLCGLIPWLWFSKSVTNSMGSLITGRGIMMQTRIPLALFPAEVVVQDAVKQLVVFGLLVVFLLLYGVQPSVHWIAALPLAAVQLILTTSMSFVVSALIPFIPDARYLVHTGLLLLMFASGIFYQYELILPEHRSLFFLNPMANLIRNYREIFLYNQWPNWQDLAVILLVSIAIFAFVLWLFNRYSTTYVRAVLES